MALIVYLHGFNSSPLSDKAELTREYLEQFHPEIDFEAPSIPDKPALAKPFLQEWVRDKEFLGLIGGSLGGFYSSWLAETLDLPAVLVNPAVRPFDLLQRYGAEQVNPYTGVAYTLEDSDHEVLRSCYIEQFNNPSRFKVLLQTGDETLDYRQAADKYQKSLLTIEDGGDHRFQNYQHHLPSIVEFILGFKPLDV